MFPRGFWHVVPSGIFLLLAIARWPRAHVPVGPHAGPGTANHHAMPAPGLVRDDVLAPGLDLTDTPAPPPDSAPEPVLGPGLRGDMESVSLVWDELKATAPRLNPWEARVTASVLANLLLDAAHQDALWRGRIPDAATAREQSLGFLEESGRLRLRQGPTPFPR